MSESESIEDRFERLGDDEYLKFDRVENKRSTRPDLHAMLLLNSLFPSTSDMVSWADHDIIGLDVDEDHIETLTDEQIVELCRCGCHYSTEYDCLCMFA